MDISEQEALERILGDASATPTPLSYALMRSITANFSTEIGRGGFGVVYRGILRNGKVAVKKLDSAHDISDKLFLDEIKCLIRAKHKNIVRFLGYCSHSQGELMEFNGTYVMAEVRKRLLCFEYVPNGDIHHYLQEKPHGGKWHERYKMIKGICQGLQYLHQERISHLDLKPENVMLDAHMEPKITDLGLSRIFGEVQSRIVTKNIRGTPGYIAPEMIDKGEISFKSDIYSLGIIVIKLLTGHDSIDFKNWHELLDVECPRVKSCIEIARNCIDADRDKRPTVGEIIHKLNEMESMIQVNLNAFPWTELLDVYPLELSFPFEINKQISSTLSLINKTDLEVGFLIIPDSPDRYESTHLLSGILTSMSTRAITLKMRAQQEPAPDMDKLEIVMFTMSSDDDGVKARQLMSASFDEHEHTLKQIQELAGEVHRATLTSVVVVSDSKYYPKASTTFMDTWGGRYDDDDDDVSNYAIEVHPTEPWVLLTAYYFKVAEKFSVYIWNWQTKKRIYEYNGAAFSAKFIARKQWFVVGDMCAGTIFVHTYPSMDQVYEIKTHYDDNDEEKVKFLISIAVHPTRSLLLSYSCNGDDGSQSMKLWDWNQDWLCTGSFNLRKTVSPIIQVEFSLRDTGTFATIDTDGTAKIWKIGYLKPITKLEAPGAEVPDEARIVFAYSGDRHLITATDDQSALHIWDFKAEKYVHTLSAEKGGYIREIICHPTCPVIVTVSSTKARGSIHVWDSATYRLKKTINLQRPPVSIAFMGSRRLMILYQYGVGIMDIDLE